jgi:hypothetical protein
MNTQNTEIYMYCRMNRNMKCVVMDGCPQNCEASLDHLLEMFAGVRFEEWARTFSDTLFDAAEVGKQQLAVYTDYDQRIDLFVEYLVPRRYCILVLNVRVQRTESTDAHFATHQAQVGGYNGDDEKERIVTNRDYERLGFRSSSYQRERKKGVSFSETEDHFIRRLEELTFDEYDWIPMYFDGENVPKIKYIAQMEVEEIGDLDMPPVPADVTAEATNKGTQGKGWFDFKLPTFGIHESIENVGNKLQNTVKTEIADMKEEFRSKIDRAGTKIEGLTGRAEQVLTTAELQIMQIKETLVQYFTEKCGLTVRTVDIIIHVVTCLIQMWRHPEMKFDISLMIGTGIGLVETGGFVYRLVNKSEKLFELVGLRINKYDNEFKKAMEPNMPPLVAQLEMTKEEERDVEDALRIAIEAFMTLFQANVMEAQGMNLTFPNTRIKELSDSFIKVTNVAKGIEWLLKTTKTVYEWSFEKIYGHPPVLADLGSLLSRCISWMKTAQAFTVDGSDESYVNSIELCNQIIAHHDSGMKLQVEIQTRVKDRTSYHAFNNAVKDFEEIYIRAKTVMATAKSRPRPVVVHAVGPSNNGKSNFNKIFSYDVYQAWRQLHPELFADVEAEPASIVFEKKPDTVHFDGYLNQFAYVIDDMFQSLDTKVIENQMLDLIYMGNNNPYSLNMAAIQLKGNTYFTSRLIISNSNLEKTSQVAATSVRSATAFLRRRDILIRLTFKDGVPKSVAEDGSFRDVWKIEVLNPMSEEKTGEILTYRDLVLKTVTLMDSYHSYATGLEKSLKDHPLNVFAQAGGEDNVFIEDDEIVPALKTAEEDLIEKMFSGKEEVDEIEELQCSLECKIAIRRLEALYKKYLARDIGNSANLKKILDELKSGDLSSKIRGYIPKGLILQCGELIFKSNCLPSFEFCFNVNCEESKGRDFHLHYTGEIEKRYQMFLAGRIEEKQGYAFTNAGYVSPFGLCYADSPLGRELLGRSKTLNFYCRAIAIDVPVETNLLKGDIINFLSGNEFANRCRYGKDAFVRWIKSLIGYQQECENSNKLIYEGNTFVKVISVILCGGAFITTIYALTKLVRYLLGHTTEAQTYTVSNGASSGGVTKMENIFQRGPGKIARGSIKKLNMRGESGDNSTANTTSVVLKNSAALGVYSDDGSRIGSLTAVFVKDRICITVKHMLSAALKHIEQNRRVWCVLNFVNTERKDVAFCLNDCAVVMSEGTDWMLLRVPANCGVQQFKDITNHIIGEKEYADGAINKCTLMAISDNLSVIAKETDSALKIDSIDYTLGSQKLTSYHVITYPLSTKNGHCGSPLFVYNTRIVGKWMGIHICGDGGGKAASVSIVREEIIGALTELQAEESIDDTIYRHTCPSGSETCLSATKTTLPILNTKVGATSSGSFQAEVGIDFESFSYLNKVGEVAQEDIHILQTKDADEKGLLYGKFGEVKTAPSMLKPTWVNGEKVVPLINILNKWNKGPVQKKPKENLIEKIEDMIVDSIPCKVPVRILTDDESYNGVKQWNYVKPIVLKTSGGFGFHPTKHYVEKYRLYPGKGKRPYFSVDDDCHLTPHPYLVEKVKELEKKYENGETHVMITETNIKAERRPIAKALAGNSRGFFCASLDHLCVGRKYCGSFIENAMSDPVSTGIAIGVNPASIQWGSLVTEFAQSLGPVVPAAMDSDGSEWDTSIIKIFLASFYRVMNKFYKRWQRPEQNETEEEFVKRQLKEFAVRMNVVKDAGITKTILVVRDLIRCEFERGHVSGHFATAIENCVIGLIAHNYFFLYFIYRLRQRTIKGDALEWYCRTFGYIDDEVREILADVRRLTQNFDIDTHNVKRYFKVMMGGDDNYYLMNPTIAKLYTFKVMITIAQWYGFKFTDPAKTGNDEGIKRISEITFLKRRFVKWDDGFYRAPMDIPDIIEVLNWKSINIDAREAAYLNAEWALREFYHHGPIIFSHWRIKINNALVEENCSPVSLSFDYLDTKFFNGDLAVDYDPLQESETSYKMVAQMDVAPDKPKVPERKSITNLDVLDDTLFNFAYLRYYLFRSELIVKLELEIGMSLTSVIGLERFTDLVFHVVNEYLRPKLEVVCKEEGFISYNKQAYVADILLFPSLCNEFRFKKTYSTFVTMMDHLLDRIYAPLRIIEHSASKLLPMVAQIAKYSEPKTIHPYQERCLITKDSLGRSIKLHNALGKASEKMVEMKSKRKRDAPLGHQYARINDFVRNKKRLENEAGVDVDKKHPMPDVGYVHDAEFQKVPYQAPKNAKVFNISETRTPSAVLAKIAELNAKYIKEKLPMVAQMDLQDDPAVKEPSEHEDQLTKIIDSTPVASNSVAKAVAMYKNMHAFPQDTLTDVMERFYQIGNFTWSSANSSGTNLGGYSFPHALMAAVPNLESKSNQYQFMTADVEVEIKVQATVFHYGKLLIAWLPWCLVGHYKFGNLYTASQCNSQIISASSQKSIRFKIPWSGPTAAWNQSITTNTGFIGSMNVYVLNPLNSTGATGTVTVPVQIFAKFSNVRLSAPTLNNSYFMAKNLGFKAQMKSEQAKKSEGVITSTLNAVKGIMPVVSLIPGVGSASGVISKGLDLATSFTSALGLNKPQNVAPTNPVLQPLVNNLALMEGLVTDHSLAVTPSNATANQGVYNMEDEHSLLKLAMKPGILEANWSFDGSSVVYTVVKTYKLTPNMCPTYSYVATPTIYRSFFTPMAAVASNFYAWRGGIKFCFSFSLPAMLSCRIRIAWHPTIGELPVTMGAEGGNVISMIVDLSGDTDVCFTVPYLQEILSLPCNDSWSVGSYNGGISISILGPVVSASSTGSTTINCTTWVAAASDMQFILPFERSVTTSRNYDTTNVVGSGTVIAQMKTEEEAMNTIDQIFEKDFPSILPSESVELKNVFDGDTVLDVRTLLHRFQQTTTLAGAAVTNNWVFVSDENTGENSYNLFNLWFMFYKGSKHYKLVQLVNGLANNISGFLLAEQAFDDTGTQITPTGRNSFGRLGLAMENFPYKPSLEVRLPHYSRFPFNTTQQHSILTNSQDGRQSYLAVYWQPSTTTTDQPGFRVLMSIGDDWSFGWARGAPTLIFQ